MREVVADARACGTEIADDIVEQMLTYTDKMTPYRTSMKIDYDERHPMEVEAIFGNPLRASQKAGVKSPLLEELYHLLRFVDARNSGSRN
jgi:2-dehydropantoate 2-reductase